MSDKQPTQIDQLIDWLSPGFSICMGVLSIIIAAGIHWGHLSQSEWWGWPPWLFATSGGFILFMTYMNARTTKSETEHLTEVPWDDS